MAQTESPDILSAPDYPWLTVTEFAAASGISQEDIANIIAGFKVIPGKKIVYFAPDRPEYKWLMRSDRIGRSISYKLNVHDLKNFQEFFSSLSAPQILPDDKEAESKRRAALQNMSPLHEQYYEAVNGLSHSNSRKAQEGRAQAIIEIAKKNRRIAAEMAEITEQAIHSLGNRFWKIGSPLNYALYFEAFRSLIFIALPPRAGRSPDYWQKVLNDLKQISRNRARLDFDRHAMRRAQILFSKIEEARTAQANFEPPADAVSAELPFEAERKARPAKPAQEREAPISTSPELSGFAFFQANPVLLEALARQGVVRRSQLAARVRPGDVPKLLNGEAVVDIKNSAIVIREFANRISKAAKIPAQTAYATQIEAARRAANGPPIVPVFRRDPSGRRPLHYRDVIESQRQPGTAANVMPVNSGNGYASAKAFAQSATDCPLNGWVNRLVEDMATAPEKFGSTDNKRKIVREDLKKMKERGERYPAELEEKHLRILASYMKRNLPTIGVELADTFWSMLQVQANKHGDAALPVYAQLSVTVRLVAGIGEDGETVEAGGVGRNPDARDFIRARLESRESRLLGLHPDRRGQVLPRAVSAAGAGNGDARASAGERVRGRFFEVAATLPARPPAMPIAQIEIPHTAGELTDLCGEIVRLHQKRFGTSGSPSRGNAAVDTDIPPEQILSLIRAKLRQIREACRLAAMEAEPERIERAAAGCLVGLSYPAGGSRNAKLTTGKYAKEVLETIQAMLRVNPRIATGGWGDVVALRAYGARDIIGDPEFLSQLLSEWREMARKPVRRDISAARAAPRFQPAGE